MARSLKKTPFQAQSVRDCIVRTVSYAEVFSKPISIEKAYLLLQSKEKVSGLLFLHELDRMIERGEIMVRAGYLGRNEKVFRELDLLGLRQVFLRRLRSAQLIARWFATIPTVTEVYLTGSTATELPGATDDLDFFVVTKRDTVWITRLFLVLIGVILGRYARSSQAGERSWCLNMWSDQHHLQVPLEHRSIFTAHEVVFARPLLDPKASLSLHNDWVREYFPNLEPMSPSLTTEVGGDLTQQKNRSSLLFPIFRFFNPLAYQLQRWFMRHHRTIEIVERTHAYFHPRDTANIVLNKYHAILKKNRIDSTP